jgi:hypothetical protein
VKIGLSTSFPFFFLPHIAEKCVLAEYTSEDTTFVSLVTKVHTEDRPRTYQLSQGTALTHDGVRAEMCETQ